MTRGKVLLECLLDSSVSKSVTFIYGLYYTLLYPCNVFTCTHMYLETHNCCLLCFLYAIRIFTFFVSVLLGEATHLRGAGVVTG